MSNLKRISQVKPNELPFQKSTLYKLRHLGRFPGLFVKLGGALFLDLEQLDRLIEEGRLDNRAACAHASQSIECVPKRRK